jgi:UDP-N-acetylmuramate-alanine ligase
MIVEKIKELGQDCIYISTMEEAAQYLKEHLEPGDLCLTSGSGSIDKLDSFIVDKK